MDAEFNKNRKQLEFKKSSLIRLLINKTNVRNSKLNGINSTKNYSMTILTQQNG